MIHISRNFLALSTGLLIGVLHGTGLSAQPVMISDLAEAHAIVECRTVLLRDDQGELETIVISPEVRNLPQVHPGDHMLVSVHRSVALEMSKAGPGPAPAVEETGRAAGTKLAAFRSETVRARVDHGHRFGNSDCVIRGSRPHPTRASD